MKISVIVLLENAYFDFPDYLLSLGRTMDVTGKEYEIVVIANATGNFFRAQQKHIRLPSCRVRAFEFITPVTQAVCLKAVLKEVTGDLLVICGSYQQLTAESLLRCIRGIDESTDLISPWREKRVDPVVNQLQSKLFNWVTRRIVKTNLHDFNCTVKICRQSLLEEIDLYGNMFRFLPVLAEARGFMVRECSVEHYEERGDTGFFGVSLYLSRFLDIFTIFFNTRFHKKPLRFFSTVGLGFVGLGAFLMGFLFIEWLFFGATIGNRPMFLASLLVAILGVLVGGAGLLGEIIVFTNGRHKKEYVIEKEI